MQESQTIVTAIPSHKTRAMFECMKFPEESGTDSSGLGFIMFECGLEGIGTKFVKRSQFEKSENAEKNLKAATDPELSSTDINQTTTNSSTVININAYETTNSTSKLNDITGSKFALKKPTTPKPSTPRERLLAGLDVKSRDSSSKEKEMPGKENKIKFSLKPPETINAIVSDETVKEQTALGKQQQQQSQQQSQQSNAQSSTNGGSNGSNAVVSISNNNGRTSSCVIDFKTVWFNFAAPPRAPITRKIDFTRYNLMRRFEFFFLNGDF